MFSQESGGRLIGYPTTRARSSIRITDPVEPDSSKRNSVNQHPYLNAIMGRVDDVRFLAVLDDQIRIRLAGLQSPAETPISSRQVIVSVVNVSSGVVGTYLVLAGVFGIFSSLPATAVSGVVLAGVGGWMIHRRLSRVRAMEFMCRNHEELDRIARDLAAQWSPRGYGTGTRMLIRSRVMELAADRR